MSEPVSSVLTDSRFQELKEAVCDAVLERTRRITAGEGEHGRVILGDKPSRVLSSGFVLPRLNVDGDDESSDIRIASHGIDMRLRRDDHGSVMIRPTFAVYIRALPSAQELFARNGRLIPPADFSKSAKQHLRDQIRFRLRARPAASTPAERAAARREITRDVRAEMGVVLPLNAARETDVEPADECVAVVARGQDIRTRLRIPSGVSRTYEVPQKWVRVPVAAPCLELRLPCEPHAWRTAANEFRQRLVDAARDACETWIASPEGNLWAWRPGLVPSEAFWEPAAWDAFLARVRTAPPEPSRLVPPMDVQILVDPLPDALDASIVSLRIAFDNLRAQDNEMECGAFGVALSIELPPTALIPMRLERVRRSYHLSGFLSMPAVGVNGGVEDHGVRDGSHVLRTTWMPRYVLPRLHAITIAAVPTTYSALAAEAQDVATLHELPREMLKWIEEVERDAELPWADEPDVPGDEAVQQARFLADLDAWRREADRVAKGSAVLVRSRAAWEADRVCDASIPYRAWLLMNLAFGRATSGRTAAPSGWRLFQLAFVLAHVPTLASRVQGFERDFDAAFDEDAASLLYMSTGGGKTEAFFGTIVYALFLDRLRGKHRGVTAMLHYPLRLLTIQQAQRLARLLASAELVRREAGVKGAPFEIGFWVGGSNTPNSTEIGAGCVRPELLCIPTWRARPIAAEGQLADPETGDKTYIAARDAWNKLPECPFCGAATGLRLFPERHHRLGIVCGADDCPWNAAHRHTRSPEPLPFLLVDTDIYRRAPAVLLGTVDKLALLGQSPHTVNRLAGMLGMARLLEGDDDGLLHSTERAADELPEGYRRLAPSWAAGYELFYDPFPSLIIQDELHLLDESLGTFGGLFETGFFAWLRELAKILERRACRVLNAPEEPRLPHVIGATATAADAAKHVSALYQKRVVQFPHPGPSLHGGFYVRLAEFSPGSEAHAARTVPGARKGVHPRDREAAAPWARVYASIMTNGRLHTVTTLSVLAAHAATITRWLRDLVAQDPARRDRAATEMRENISVGRWSTRRRAAIDAEIATGRHDRLATLVDLHRIALTYVTNKKGGDQILAAIEPEVAEGHEAMGTEYALPEFKMELISGGVDVKGIQSVIRAAEARFDPTQEDVSGALRGIVATSAISHGVDVDTFNAIAFAGMPSDIAEYIQASSRVGRTHVGFSLLVPTPQARRDRFIVGVHEAFHRLLERMISPPAIERWADRALERTIPSLVQTWLAGVHYQRAFVAAPDGRKSSVRLPATVEAVNELFAGIGGPTSFDDCVAFVRAAVGVSASTGGAGRSADYYRELVLRGVREVRDEIASGNFTGPLHEFWENAQNPLRRNKPMMSLRDVDESGRIVGSSRTLKNKGVTSDSLAAAMAFLRNRGASRRRRWARSETDGED